MEAKGPPATEPRAGWFSRLTFSWVTPLLQVGARQPVEGCHVWELDDEERSASLHREFERVRALRKPGESVFWTLLALSRPTLLVSAAFMAVYVACQLAMPLLLRAIVSSVDQGSDDALNWAIALFGASLLGAVANQQQFHRQFRMGQRLRALVISIVYRRALSAKGHIQAGSVTNLLSGDAQKLFEVMPQLHTVWSSPIQAGVAIYFLIDLLGPSAIAGIIALCMLGPLSVIMARFLQSMRQKHMVVADDRVRLCTEVLHAMQIVKLFSWTESFVERILQLRDGEMKWIRKELGVWAGTICLMIIWPVAGVTCTFAAYVLSGNQLTSVQAFTSLAFFNALRFPLQQLSITLAIGVQARVALQRMDAFLRGAQRIREGDASSALTDKGGVRDPTDTGASDAPVKTADIAVEADDEPVLVLKSATFKWPEGETGAAGDTSKAAAVSADSEPFALKHVDVAVRHGELAIVVGPVGAGKSTLVAGILGEALCADGTVTVNGSISFAGQTSWIQNGTLRDNVVFGRPFDEERYREVLTACCLWTDLKELPGGDMAVIGEKGITLSGGQKARVSLARAAYVQPDLVLLDDVLSALDAHTGRTVFRALLGPEGLLSRSARVLVTHATNWLSHADTVLVLHEGNVAYAGNFIGIADALPGDEVDGKAATESEPPAQRDGAAAGHSGQRDGDSEGEERQSLRGLLQMLSRTVQEGHEQRQRSSSSEAASRLRSRSRSRTRTASGEAQELSVARTELMTVEDRAVGSVAGDVYLAYLKAGGGWTAAALLLVLFIFERMSFVGGDWWLATWTDTLSVDADKAQPPFGLPMQSEEGVTTWYLSIYAGLACINAGFVLSRLLYFVRMGSRAAEVSFRRVLQSVMASPMSFFETTPLGRIVSRLSYDVESMDQVLIQRLMEAIASMFWAIGAVTTLMAITPWTTVVIVPMAYLFWRVQSFYRRTCRELQRLDAISRSPIQAHTSETLVGLTTIRAYKQSERFIDSAHAYIDANTRAVFAYTSVARWLGVRVDSLGALLTFVTALLCWVSRDALPGGLAGMAVAWTFSLQISMIFLVNGATEAEARMNSVERIFSFIRLPSEAPLHVSAEATPPSTWPDKGRLTLDGVVLRYRPELQPALRGVTVDIAPGERVGIVGRTGAGKSSIVSAVTRLVECEAGTITVDGVNLKTVGLDDVRGRAFTVVPQNPVLMSGTIRFNLDPFERSSDKEIWDALRRVRMGSVVQLVDGGLDGDVSESGEPFSVGERQLLCLARALLRRPRILILDEATASVDRDTDEVIQRTVRTAFGGATMLIVAHRLDTVADADRIVVMDEGVVKECGAPAALLSRPDSLLSRLAASTGSAGEAHIRALAADAAAARAAAPDS